MNIELVKVDTDNISDVIALEVQEEQRIFVMPNADSIANSAVSDYAHLYFRRAIQLDEKIVGFAQYQFGELGEWDENECTIWHLMVDKSHQRRGIGIRAMSLLIKEIKAHNRCQLIDIYYHPNNEPAKKLYAQHGFKETGFRDNGDIIAEINV